VTEDALRLLRAGCDIHAERAEAGTFGPGTELDLAGAAGRIDIFAGSLLWEACVAELEWEGAIVPSPVARHGASGVPYVVTLRGVRLLGGT
jgi:hypothetical protein